MTELDQNKHEEYLKRLFNHIKDKSWWRVLELWEESRDLEHFNKKLRRFNYKVWSIMTDFKGNSARTYNHNKNSKLKERKKLARSRVRKLKLAATKYENIFRFKLSKTEYKFIFQKAFYDEWYFCIVDFYLPEYKLAIELDGRHHYTNYKQRKRDKGHIKFLKSIGIDVIRLSNKEAEKMTLRKLRSMVTKGR